MRFAIVLVSGVVGLGLSTPSWATPAQDLAAMRARLGPVAPDVAPELSHQYLQNSIRDNGPDTYKPLSSELKYEFYMFQKMCDRKAFDRDNGGEDMQPFADTIQEINQRRPDLLRAQDVACGVVLLRKLGASDAGP